MPFYSTAPASVVKHYIALALEHNDPKTSEAKREINRFMAHGVLDVVRLAWGDVAAGMMVTEADVAAGALVSDAPLSGGFLLNIPAAA